MKLKYIWISSLIGMMFLIVTSYILINYMDISIGDLSQRGTYFLQIAMILLTIISAPVALKLVNRDRFDDSISPDNNALSKYKTACICRLMFFSTLLALNCLLYILTSNVSFFYLSIIILFMTMFARGN